MREEKTNLHFRKPVNGGMQGEVEVTPGADVDALMDKRHALSFKIG